MDDNFDLNDIVDVSSDSESILESLLDAKSHLFSLAHESDESSLEEVYNMLEQFQESGYGVFAITEDDSVADPIDSDPRAEELLELALERRRDEGLNIQATHAIISTCGHVFIINSNNIIQCNVVRNVG
tara:strand:- start:171423 stop:171809 length:387 start_codon:yes stop_codon:yes gene_type:complete